jgi:formate dehydrogenase major subunit
MLKLSLFSKRANSTQRAPQPFSPQSQAKASRLDGAIKTDGVCPYCAVGCGLNIYTKGGRLIDIEGNPESPISQGTLCPKGANSFQLTENPHRVRKVLYRAPYARDWVEKPLDWAMDQIAHRLKEARDKGYQAMSDDGQRLGIVPNVGSLGGATLDNEENYLIKKLLGAGLGLVSIENQARI